MTLRWLVKARPCLNYLFALDSFHFYSWSNALQELQRHSDFLLNLNLRGLQSCNLFLRRVYLDYACRNLTAEIFHSVSAVGQVTSADSERFFFSVRKIKIERQTTGVLEVFLIIRIISIISLDGFSRLKSDVVPG